MHGCSLTKRLQTTCRGAARSTLGALWPAGPDCNERAQSAGSAACPETTSRSRMTKDHGKDPAGEERT